ncbi:hypothetical protein GCM10022233_25420 [Streptomyces shaanxiensis]|uniref:Secreted protein n=1 Tax=Streptomyces shaanxiensis TaxID=653357 RepID=A0ABP7UUN8_9ACTN
MAARTSLSTRAARAESTAASCVTSVGESAKGPPGSGSHGLCVSYCRPPLAEAHTPHTDANKLQPLATLVVRAGLIET